VLMLCSLWILSQYGLQLLQLGTTTNTVTINYNCKLLSSVILNSKYLTRITAKYLT
jgi:hypothetical protein